MHEVIYIYVYIFFSVPQQQTSCVDSQGQKVEDGEEYVPNSNDPCTQCTCDKTFPVMCHSVACSPPQHCEPVDNTCCEYVCNGTRPAEEAPGNLGTACAKV